MIPGMSQTIDKMTDFKFKIYGNVEKIEETSYVLDEDLKILKDGWETSWESDKVIFFNKLGKPQKIDYLDKNRNVTRSDLFEYHNGKIVLSKLKYSTTINKYDKNGLLMEVYQEVSQPELIKTGLEEPNSIVYESKLIYQYNDSGEISSVKEVSATGSVLCIANYKYHPTEKYLEKITNDCQGLIEKHEYKYQKGQITQITWSDNIDGKIEETYYLYEDGQLVNETWKLFDEGEYDGQVVTKYENCNEIEVQESDSEGHLEYIKSFKYDFDDKGNWIKKYIMNEDENYLIRRHIVYEK